MIYSSTKTQSTHAHASTYVVQPVDCWGVFSLCKYCIRSERKKLIGSITIHCDSNDIQSSYSIRYIHTVDIYIHTHTHSEITYNSIQMMAISIVRSYDRPVPNCRRRENSIGVVVAVAKNELWNHVTYVICYKVSTIHQFVHNFDRR